jgi:hypothetical protein
MNRRQASGSQRFLPGTIGPGEIMARAHGFPRVRYEFKIGDLVLCSLSRPLLGTPHICVPGGSRYLMRSGTQPERGPVVECWSENIVSHSAWALPEDAPGFYVEESSSAQLYRLTGSSSGGDSARDTVLCCLESESGSNLALEILLPARIVRVVQPISPILVAFCFFLSVEYVYRQCISIWPPPPPA